WRRTWGRSSSYLPRSTCGLFCRTIRRASWTC
ncbi:MAG: hypothetical protein AVDCRST_MAG05-5034, partial [uncultured Rubrobacteraceae bacterium]